MLIIFYQKISDMEFWFKMLCGMAFGMLFVFIIFCGCSFKKKKRRRKRVRRTDIQNHFPSGSVPRSPYRSDEIVYTTVRPVVNRSPSTASSIINAVPSIVLDNLSISSEEIDNLSKNPSFRKDPLKVLRRAGATSAELSALMSHPNFKSDPLAALRVPKKDSDHSSIPDKLDSILETSELGEMDDEPFLH